ncbi:MAG: adenylyltransferase/cytidyltransferase family protein [Clostridia bacterium]|nr:adenylyltransferase/cytidyltransferase family protein [Clostridia bacterium]
MQPLHIGHIGMIKKALSENDRVIILIGSANKEGTTRNPIGIDIRREILEETLQEEFKEERQRIIVKELPDWSEETDIASNLEWGRYLYYNVVSVTCQKDFSMYFSDEPEIIENWFQDDNIRKRVNLKLFERSNMFEAVSSTKIRKAFIENDKIYIEKSTSKAVQKRYEIIREILLKI